jgi:hypothetical protein
MQVLRKIFPWQLVFLCQVPIHVAWGLTTYHRSQNRVTLPKDLISSRQCDRRCPRGSSTSPFGLSTLALSASKDEDGEVPKKKGSTKKKVKTKKKSAAYLSTASAAETAAAKEEEKARKKEEIMKQLRNKLGEKNQVDTEQGKKKGDKGSLLDKLNPFQAGQSLRQTLGTLTSLGSILNQQTKQKYYLDDRFLESSGGVLSERNPYLERQEDNTYVPEVLVVGATGEIGRLVVRRLLLEGRFRVRVLVRDLYSQTLNLLGTGVTYCQGDLGNMESLEYALTDVDKIVFCASAPRPDEPDFQEKFEYFLKENLDSKVEDLKLEDDEKYEATGNDVEWEQLSPILEVRAQLAEQVDSIGMQNLVRAYQNVRHADYGTSQAAKRSVFKFSSRPADFNLFSLDEDTVEFLANKMVEEEEEDSDSGATPSALESGDDDYDDDDVYAEYDYSEYDEDDFDEDDEVYEDVEARRDSTVKSQIKWIRNEFGHGVFLGKVPKTDSGGMGGEAAIVSSRLRSREDPESGIDLSGGFAGFIVRLVGDGSNYEAFVRTEAYEKTGIEYVCQFATATKPTTREKKSRNKFLTARLAFDNFKPVLQKEISENAVVPSFNGSDVRYIGFRYRSASNPKQNKLQDGDNVSFYIALSYVKVYRQQPEPEFIYLSDARIPPVVRNGMVRHDQRRLVVEGSFSDSAGKVGDVVQILDEKTLQNVNKLERSPEETYFKFRGEEVLKRSGLSYTIVRVAGYNESPSGEASTIGLSSVSSFCSWLFLVITSSLSGMLTLLNPCCWSAEEQQHFTCIKGRRSTSVRECFARPGGIE